MEKENSGILGKLSIISCGAGFTIPPLIYALGQALGLVEDLRKFGQACWLVFAGFLVASIILGISGWNQKWARVGFGISIAVFVLALIWAAVPT